MSTHYNEQALESSIEKSLVGVSLEDLKNEGKTLSLFNEENQVYITANKYYIGSPSDFDKRYAIDTTRFWDFLENTQKLELEKLKVSPDWQLKILERFERMIKKKGLLHLLKKGLDVDNAHFTLFYEAPSASSAQSIKDNFKKNQFSVTRQLRYSSVNAGEEIDMVIFINGLPFCTIELKNAWTGQTAAVQGIHQYKLTRDFKQPLLEFGRCLVHFAVDTDEVYMTTKLQGKDTFFLPFNKGNNLGKGNPVNPNGHKSAYLWEEVFQKENIAKIIQHFMLLEGADKDPLNKKFYIFPRYHQLDVVAKLINDVQENGVGGTYLIQHSAGSGKSNSITWAAFQLIELENTDGNPMFDSVIVVTDRRILDKQLRDNIKSFSDIKNIIGAAYSSNDLKLALEGGKRVIITTIQKFPHIIDSVDEMSDKRFAVIIDEAHSSQGGTAADKMNQVLGKLETNEEGEVDGQDLIIRAMEARKMRSNASYFAFTATPKNATLERFGVKQDDGSFKPFHLYSMKQAIEEGFILDVLSNYTTYRSYYQLQKSIEDDPEFNTKKAQQKLKAFVERDERTIEAKARIMIDHFVQQIYDRKLLKGKAKAMVVTQSIESAIRYYKEIKKILEEKNNPFKVVVAFSGTKMINGVEHTESGMNGFPDTETKDKFDTDEYKILVVANKYLTGFDQPKLTAMYVDKKLQGVLCVQALSRLNRSNPKLGKKTEDLFVLDFFNDSEDIKRSFDPYYTSTSLSKATDVNVLHELKEELDDSGVYEWYEVEDFNTRFFKGEPAESLSPIIDVAAQRFNKELELNDDQKADLKIKAKQFVKVYGQVAAIIPFEKLEWEKLFWFAKFLIPKMIVKRKEDEILDELLESVDLATYGIERVKLNEKLELDADETRLDATGNLPRGAHADDDKARLEEIIRDFNERWFANWDATPEDKRQLFFTFTDKVVTHPDYETKYLNNPDEHTKQLAYKKIFDEVALSMRKFQIEFAKKLTDEHFKQDMLNSTQRFLKR
ncbi:type I restriction endonuclease subunit R [Faecalibacter macacae]|uniref:Type I restriction endonuclease subunit R n=1 Tax=Faecalibacter macacae TaxID=1859289 RepID=A0A3L9MDD7_9FLAO|nr:DEAD/DEAH box helicase family protein [Faecalibacter macacae]RLZ10703.1 type I restriction endonuclease subunit R [Faecalibacter macacae]